MSVWGNHLSNNALACVGRWPWAFVPIDSEVCEIGVVTKSICHHLENVGIEPTTSCTLSTRSTN